MTRVGCTRTRTRRRPAALGLLGLAGVLASGALLSGCGIRATSVPVDAGAAPSRVGCVVPGEQETAGTGGSGAAREELYLVCGSRVSPVDRRIDVSGDDRLTAARELLDALQADPDAAEGSAGFETAVPDGLGVDGPRSGDPAGTLRLSTAPDRLPPFALAQLVCTYAGTPAAAHEESVILAGPSDRAGGPRRYECGTALRTRPDAGRTAGTPVTAVTEPR